MIPHDIQRPSGQWYCRTMGMELGPMDWSDLVDLVRHRELSCTDIVRATNSNQWTLVSAIHELAGELAPATTASAEEIPSPPESQSAIQNSDREEKWYCRVAQVEYGPMRFQQLQRIVAHRQLVLSPHDLVRKGSHGPWVRVESIPALMLAGGHYEGVKGVTRDAFSPPEEQETPQMVSQPSTILSADTFLEILNSLTPIVAIIQTVLKLAWTYGWIITGMLIWIGFNSVAVFFPEFGEKLAHASLSGATSPMTWFLLMAIFAYGVAIWLQFRKPI